MGVAYFICSYLKKMVTMFLLLILKAIAERRGVGRGGGKGYFPYNLLKGEGQAYLSPPEGLGRRLIYINGYKH